jgi:hypothetical protein
VQAPFTDQLDHSEQHANQGGLAGAVETEQGVDLAGLGKRACEPPAYGRQQRLVAGRARTASVIMGS